MRDNGQCAFIGTRGRCTERGFLEFHHVVPFTDGGAALVDNIEPRCRTHNGYELSRWFGTQEPPVVRERRCFSEWSNSVRTEPPVEPQSRVQPEFVSLNRFIVSCRLVAADMSVAQKTSMT